MKRSNSERCKEYRKTLKVKDPELYEHRRAHYVEQNQANMKKPKTPEQLERQRLLTKLRMHRHRYVIPIRMCKSLLMMTRTEEAVFVLHFLNISFLSAVLFFDYYRLMYRHLIL